MIPILLIVLIVGYFSYKGNKLSIDFDGKIDGTALHENNVPQNSSMDSLELESSALLEARRSYFIEEYKTLRTEIIERIKLQTQIKGFVIVGTVAVCDWSLKQSNLPYLLLFSIVILVFSYAWAFNNLRVTQLSKYLMSNERLIEYKYIFGMSDDIRGWESYVHKIDSERILLGFRPRIQHAFGVFVGLQFFVVCVAVFKYLSKLDGGLEFSMIDVNWVRVRNVSLTTEIMLVMSLMSLLLTSIFIVYSESDMSKRNLFQRICIRRKSYYLFVFVFLLSVAFFSIFHKVTPLILIVISIMGFLITGYGVEIPNVCAENMRKSFGMKEVVINTGSFLKLEGEAVSRFHGDDSGSTFYAGEGKIINGESVNNITRSILMNSNSMKFSIEKVIKNDLFLVWLFLCVSSIFLGFLLNLKFHNYYFEYNRTADSGTEYRSIVTERNSLAKSARMLKAENDTMQSKLDDYAFLARNTK